MFLANTSTSTIKCTYSSFAILPLHTIIIFFMFRPFMGHRQGKNTSGLVQCFHLGKICRNSDST